MRSHYYSAATAAHAPTTTNTDCVSHAAIVTISAERATRSVSIERGTHTNKTAGVVAHPSVRIATAIATMVVITTDNIVVVARVGTDPGNVNTKVRFPQYGEPLFITYDFDVCNRAVGSPFWDGFKTPAVCVHNTAGAFVAGLVVLNQPRQIIADIGLVLISVCVRGPCTARLDGPGSCYSADGNGDYPEDPLPGDKLHYSFRVPAALGGGAPHNHTIHIGTINAVTETFCHKDPILGAPGNDLYNRRIAERYMYGTISIIISRICAQSQRALCGATR